MSESKKKGTNPGKVSSSEPRPEQNKSTYSAPASRVVKEVTYGMKQYKYMFIGLGLIALGMVLMSGGWMPSPEVWDESIIYSVRRTVLAPICILAGLVMQVFAIFKV